MIEQCRGKQSSLISWSSLTVKQVLRVSLQLTAGRGKRMKTCREIGDHQVLEMRLCWVAITWQPIDSHLYLSSQSKGLIASVDS